MTTAAFTITACAAPRTASAKKLLVCEGPSCSSVGGGARLAAALLALAPEAEVTMCGCLGGCGERANVVAGGRVVRASQALAAAGIRANIRAQRALRLKDAGDRLLTEGDAARAARAYAIALRLLPAGGARARVGVNLSTAYLEAGDAVRALRAAQLAGCDEPLDAAWLRVAQACEALDDVSGRDSALRNVGEDTRQQFEEWRRKRARSGWWNGLLGGARRR